MQWGMMKAGAAVAISIISFNMSGCGQLSDTFSTGQTAKQKPIALTSIIATTHPKLLWKQQLASDKKIKNDKVQLLILENILYGAGGSKISALDKKTGALLWQEEVGERITGGIKGNQNTVFIGTAEGSVIAFNAKTGQTQWIALLNSPVLSISNSKDNKIAFRTLNGKIHLLSANNGSVIWQRSHKTPTLSLQGASSPILTGPLLISGADDGSITAYETKTANKIWSIAASNTNQVAKLTDLDAEMKIIGTTLFTAGYHGRVSGIDMRSGKTGWSLPLSSHSGIDANKEALYVSDETGTIRKLGLLTGNIKWENKSLLGRQPTAPSIIDRSLIVVGDSQGYLHWIDTTSGKITGRIQTNKRRILLPVTVDGKNNTLYTINTNGLISAYSY
ncbi:MAG TPA: hypothetical protein ENJ33_01620 [Thiothrix sp.]|nr:hypothetical protein [Thiothrix sp.]